MSMSERKTIDLEQGWDFMQKGITKLKNILEGVPETQFSSEDYMMLYTYSSLHCLFVFGCLRSFFFICIFFYLSTVFFSWFVLQDHLQYVYSEASSWLLPATLWQV